MLFFPNAKINIGLNILSKREDGYHNLETIFYPIGWKDVLEIIPSSSPGFNCTGITVEGGENLCEKALKLLKADFDIPDVFIHLHKNIPTGAGLGGGSSDAAFTLMGLNQLFDLGISKHDLKSYALRLGADCPFFIENTPSFASGVGEELKPVHLDLKGHFLVVVKADVFVSTSEAFSGVTPKPSDFSLVNEIQKPISDWRLKNDFEESIFAHHPKLLAIKNTLSEAGALYASMSGSGSSIYALFSSKPSLSINDELVFSQQL
ncbi:MAG: 4-(cytidine 5'-diphospho)-2-C-methyl-D-erythritol kinase [Flavobacteriales bacterium]|nr:4-(cytidine 5'-diphospho)-2-C-methyl-D-erythritol kinase [Flavobacteriales bacterium]MBL6873391.1 4-(cytidine 5'-diphospho)-2-C-methyl-D-erythritol kinase [Flavobacteriales bacterium]